MSGMIWLYDEIKKKYSYDVYFSGDKDNCYKSMDVDISISPEYRLEPNDEYENYAIEIQKEEVIKHLKILIEKQIESKIIKDYHK